MNNNFIREFGRVMHETRTKKNISFEQLSGMLRTPKSKSTLKRYEDGLSKKIDWITAQDICDALMLDLNKILDTFEHTGTLEGGDFRIGRKVKSQDGVDYVFDDGDVKMLIEINKMSDDEKDMIRNIIQVYKNKKTGKD